MSSSSLPQRALRKLAAAWLVGQLLVLLTLAQILVALVPFRSYARWLRSPVAGPDAPPALVRSLRRKLPLAARLLPWRPQCLPQALAGRYVLARRGYGSRLSLGVADDHRELSAHAWLTSGGLFVCGRSEQARFSEVAAF